MRGYIDIKKMQGDTYVTTTEKRDEVCNQLLRELITFATTTTTPSSYYSGTLNAPE
jgi:hypothetical protein